MRLRLRLRPEAAAYARLGEERRTGPNDRIFCFMAASGGSRFKRTGTVADKDDPAEPFQDNGSSW